jgi:hypothetical protein
VIIAYYMPKRAVHAQKGSVFAQQAISIAVGIFLAETMTK